MPYASIDGADLFYEESGSGEPPILHHGYTSSHDCWHGVVPRLNGRYRCIGMDCRGAGDSNRATGPCSLEQYAADIVAMADHRGIERFNYAGLSMGGRLGRIATPTVVVAGAADGLRSSNSRDFQRLGSATLHVFSRVGHGIPNEVPSALSRIIADFGRERACLQAIRNPLRNAPRGAARMCRSRGFAALEVSVSGGIHRP